MSKLFGLVIDHNSNSVVDIDDASLYPSAMRVNDLNKSVKKSINNTRKERRLLRRASKKFGAYITEIYYHYLGTSVHYKSYHTVIKIEKIVS